MKSHPVPDRFLPVGHFIELRRGPQSGMIAVIEAIRGSAGDPFYVGRVVASEKQVTWYWKSVIPVAPQASVIPPFPMQTSPETHCLVFNSHVRGR